MSLWAIVLLGVTPGVALGVVGGKSVPITAAPWTVVVWEPTYPDEPRYAACAGVIIGPLHILTAGHCVVSSDKSVKPLAASGFLIEAGVSNFKHPLASDHPQFRTVMKVRVMPGFIAENAWTSVPLPDAVDHDLAVLTLTRPLDLSGADARAVHLSRANTPIPSRDTRLVIAGFGNEKPRAGVAYANGTLNEATKWSVQPGCFARFTRQILCVYEQTDTCWGDSGSGAVEPGSLPTVVGILSDDLAACQPSDEDFYASPSAPAAARFIKAATEQHH